MTRSAQLATLSTIRGGFLPSAAEARDRKRREEEQVVGLEEDSGAMSAREWPRALQPSAIQPDGSIRWDELPNVLPMRGVERYEIRDGEILLPLRSQRLQAVIVHDAPAGVIATGQWAIIEPNADLVDSHYLAWYLNHPRTRARLEGTMVGSALQFLTAAMVREFEVEIPSLVQQRQIGRVSESVSRVERLERELSIRRRSHFDTLAMTAITDQSDVRLRLDC